MNNSTLYNHRILFLSGKIDTDTSNELISKLLLLDAKNNKPIDLYINSPGGSVLNGLAIIDVMRCIRAPVHTICVGQAASMAAVILAAGEPGFRMATPHAEIMLHEILGRYMGKSLNIKVHAERMLRLQQQVMTLLSQVTHRSFDEVQEDMNNDYFLLPEQALEYGLIDQVLEVSECSTGSQEVSDE
jgi:ATP-dependent Clp protease protease subunit